MAIKDCCETSSIQIGTSDKQGPYYRCRKCSAYWHREPGRMFSEADGANLVPVFNGKGEIGLANVSLLGVDVNYSLLINELIH